VDEANKDNGNDILNKLKTTLDKIKQMIGEGAEIKKMEFSEWGQTLQEIVEGETEPKTKNNMDTKRKEKNGSKDLTDTKDAEYGSDYTDVLIPLPKPLYNGPK
jgi:hypothetical protein